MSAEIRQFVQPLTIYRYRALQEDKFKREIDCIKGNYIYCSSFEKLNDPMEGSFTVKNLVKDPEKLDINIKETVKNMRICSFSEVRHHELMWAHYAGQFEGICIGFNLSRLLKMLPNGTDFVRIYYNEEIPTIGQITAKNSTDAIAKKILSYKNHKWLYEREWRLFSPNEFSKLNYGAKQKVISSVIMGPRLKEEQKKKIYEVCQENEITCKQAKIKGYRMQFPEFRPNT